MTANKKATMQQLVLLTGFSAYAKRGAGKSELPLYTMSFPRIAFRSGEAELTYPNGQRGHKMRIGLGHALPESIFTWTGVARDAVTAPDDATLGDYVQFMPGYSGTEIYGQELTAQFPEARPEEVVEDQWILDQVGEWATVQDDRRSISFDGETPFSMVGDVFGDIETSHRIAKLLSSAPELYAALKFCVSVMESNGVIELSEIMAVEKAKSALAKAVGEG